MDESDKIVKYISIRVGDVVDVKQMALDLKLETSVIGVCQIMDQLATEGLVKQVDERNRIKWIVL